VAQGVQKTLGDVEAADEVLQTEVKRIIVASKCSYLEELLTGVLLTYLRAFAAIQYRSTQDSIDVEFERPPLPKFVPCSPRFRSAALWLHGKF
jgi:hypothetical protein